MEVAPQAFPGGKRRHLEGMPNPQAFIPPSSHRNSKQPILSSRQATAPVPVPAAAQPLPPAEASPPTPEAPAPARRSTVEDGPPREAAQAPAAEPAVADLPPHPAVVAGAGGAGMERGRSMSGTVPAGAGEEDKGLLAQAGEATVAAAGAAVEVVGDVASAAVETTKQAVAAATGANEPTIMDVEGAPTNDQGALQRGASSGRLSRSGSESAGPSTPPPLAAIVAAKREALAAGAAIPPGPPMAPLPAKPRPVGFVPTVGASASVHAVGERPAVTAEPVAAAAAEEGARAGRTTTAAGRGKTRDMDAAEDWLSELVERLWPYIRVTAEDMAWQQLPDLLLQNKPSWIHSLTLQKFQLGRKEPDIKNIRVYEDDNDLMEDVFLELELDWASKQDIEIELKVLPDDVSKWIPDFIDRTLSKLLTLVLGVEDLRVSARVRVAMRPLLRRLPIVGAVQVALLEQPTFDYKPTLGQGTAPLLPAIKSWLDNTIRDMGLAPYVLPDHFFYPIDPDAEDLQKPEGVLLLRVLEARKVPKMDFLSASDAFVELYVRSSQRHRTGVISSRHPRWKEAFELPIHVQEHQKLTLVLWDYDPYSPNDEIGRCEVKLSELEAGRSLDLWLDVVSHSEEEQERTKHDLSAGDRAIRGVAKPFVHHSTKGCQLHVQATLVKFSVEEEKLIAQAHRHGGMEKLLAGPQASRIDPRLHNVLLSGKLVVRMPRAQGISASSLFGRPSIKFVVTVTGGEEKDSAPAKLSRKGALEFTEELQVDVRGEQRRDHNASVTVALHSTGWVGGGAVGIVKFCLAELIQPCNVRNTYRLTTGQGQVTLDLGWRPYF